MIFPFYEYNYNKINTLLQVKAIKNYVFFAKKYRKNAKKNTVDTP
jgi:hypothetical protein